MRRVGFVGLGAMGSGIAGRLLDAGLDLTVWNRSPEPARALAARGARLAAEPADALGGEAVFSMLASDGAVREVLLAPGVVERGAPGLVHVNLATVSPALAADYRDRVEAAGGVYVAAPVLGRPEAAAAGKLNVIAAGPEAALRALDPALTAISAAVWPVGSDPLLANVAKIACNFALASMIETLGEAGALADAWGLPPVRLYEIMTSTLFAAPAYRTYADLIGRSAFEPAGFKLPLGLKDVGLALEAGAAKGAALPLASALRDGFLEAIAAGDGEKDWSALAAQAFRRAGRRSPGG